MKILINNLLNTLRENPHEAAKKDLWISGGEGACTCIPAQATRWINPRPHDTNKEGGGKCEKYDNINMD